MQVVAITAMSKINTDPEARVPEPCRSAVAQPVERPSKGPGSRSNFIVGSNPKRDVSSPSLTQRHKVDNFVEKS